MLDLVHLNVCGLMQTKLHSGFKYFLTFIDDKSIKFYVYFIKNKYELFKYFKIWKTQAKTFLGGKIKILHNDSGGEYFSNQFCKNNGIIKQMTTPYTLEQMEWLNAKIELWLKLQDA
jgi:hypothetical protein